MGLVQAVSMAQALLNSGRELTDREAVNTIAKLFAVTTFIVKKGV